MNKEVLTSLLIPLYGTSGEELCENICRLSEEWKARLSAQSRTLTQKDAILIIYPDSFTHQDEKPLKAAEMFLEHYVKKSFSGVHFLPMFPFSSDDGFSVIDYRQVDPRLGNWDHIKHLSQKYDLMFDAVINHTSRQCEWFQKFLAGDREYQNYYIACDPAQDYSMVTRPRTLPLLTKFEGCNGPVYVWTTFSEDQVDLNYKNPAVLLNILDLLATYVWHGAKYIRLDAISFAWKKLGECCCNLKENHLLIKVFRAFLQDIAPGTMIITETNVPHQENIAYLGNGSDEAHMVYQFALPPLVLHTYLSGSVKRLSGWLKNLDEPKKGTTYFNFLASHDGVGLQPVRNILSPQEIDMLVDSCLARGGRVSYKSNPDGTTSPYELNINYQDGIVGNAPPSPERNRKFLGSQFILLSLQGVPGVYYHSLLGSHNDIAAVEESGINRRINRHKFTLEEVDTILERQGEQQEIYREYIHLLEVRKAHPAFSPMSSQQVCDLDEKVFAVIRKDAITGEQVAAVVNISDTPVKLPVDFSGINLLDGRRVDGQLNLSAYEYQWIQMI